MHKGDKDKDIIRIVLDKEFKFKYSSLNNQNTTAYLEKLEIIKRLSHTLSIQYNLKGYLVTIDGVKIADNMYYLITAIIEHDKFQCCDKMFIDNVTGLYNRNYWEGIVNGETFNIIEKNVTLIIIDVDNLKGINDKYGHMVGDKVIKIVGQGIKRCIREDDIGLRYGGDEFSVLLFNQDKNAAYKVVERIRGKISELAEELCISIEISAGIANNTSFKDMEELFDMADKDLYIEKGKKNQKEIENDNLRREIENIRSELNGVVINENQAIINEEVLELSKKLDELIVRYLKNT